MDIDNTVNKIFQNRLNIDFDKRKDLYNENFLGPILSIPVRELILIFFDIEETFNIFISESDIDSGMFFNYNNLINRIEKMYVPK